MKERTLTLQTPPSVAGIGFLWDTLGGSFYVRDDKYLRICTRTHVCMYVCMYTWTFSAEFYVRKNNFYIYIHMHVYVIYAHVLGTLFLMGHSPHFRCCYNNVYLNETSAHKHTNAYQYLCTHVFFKCMQNVYTCIHAHMHACIFIETHFVQRMYWIKCETKLRCNDVSRSCTS
jgi:hypothetical protein